MSNELELMEEVDEIILSADDEDDLSDSLEKTVQETVTSSGKRIKFLKALSPEEAIDILKTGKVSQGWFDYRFTNSELTGYELCYEAKKYNPSITLSILTQMPSAPIREKLKSKHKDVKVIKKTLGFETMVKDLTKHHESTKSSSHYKLMEAYIKQKERADLAMQPLLDDLRATPDDFKIMFPGYGEFTARQMIEEIETNSEIGDEYAKVWLGLRSRLLNGQDNSGWLNRFWNKILRRN